MRRAILLLVLVLSACTEDEGVVIGQAAEGDACGQVSDCQPGLDCLGGTCVPLPPAPGGQGAGVDCASSNDCRADLCCGNQGVCRARLPQFALDQCGALAGAGCGFSADCDVGLICSGSGVCVVGGEGTGDVGDACEEFQDCRRP